MQKDLKRLKEGGVPVFEVPQRKILKETTEDFLREAGLETSETKAPPLKQEFAVQPEPKEMQMEMPVSEVAEQEAEKALEEAREKALQEEKRRKEAEEAERKKQEELEKQNTIEGQKRKEEEERMRLENKREEEANLEQEKQNLFEEKEELQRELNSLSSEKQTFEKERQRINADLENYKRINIYPIIEREKEVERRKKSIEEKERGMLSPSEEEKVEQKRWEIEDERKKIEEERWNAEEGMKDKREAFAKFEVDRGNFLAKEEVLKEKIANIVKRLEDIRLRRERISLEKELQSLIEQKDPLKSEKDETLEKLTELGKTMSRNLIKEREIEEEIRSIENREREITASEEKKNFERERWDKDEERRQMEKTKWENERTRRELDAKRRELDARYSRLELREKEIRDILSKIQGAFPEKKENKMEEEIKEETKVEAEPEPPVTPETPQTSDMPELETETPQIEETPAPQPEVAEPEIKESTAAEEYLKSDQPEFPQISIDENLRKELIEGIVKEEEGIPSPQMPEPVITAKKPSPSKKLVSRIIAIVVSAALIFFVFTFWFWYFKVRKPEQTGTSSGATATSTATSTIVTEEIFIGAPLITVDATETLEFTTSTQDLVNSFSLITKNEYDKGKFVRVVVKDMVRKKEFSLTDYLNAFRITIPQAVLAKLASSSTVFLYSLNRGVNSFGIVMKQTENAASAIRSWESTMEKDTDYLFTILGKRARVTSSFSQSVYKGVVFRYISFPGSNFGLTYTVVNNFFIITSSGESIIQTIDSIIIPRVESPQAL